MFPPDFQASAGTPSTIVFQLTVLKQWQNSSSIKHIQPEVHYSNWVRVEKREGKWNTQPRLAVKTCNLTILYFILTEYVGVRET